MLDKSRGRIPDTLGSKRMAIRVAELARAGLPPHWMPGAVPRCAPSIVKRNQHGTHAGTVVVGIDRVHVRGQGARATWKTIDILACPVTFSPQPQQTEAARRGYDDRWQALGWLRDGLIAGGMLREVEVAGAMPKAQSWHRVEAAKGQQAFRVETGRRQNASNFP